MGTNVTGVEGHGQAPDKDDPKRPGTQNGPDDGGDDQNDDEVKPVKFIACSDRTAPFWWPNGHSLGGGGARGQFPAITCYLRWWVCGAWNHPYAATGCGVAAPWNCSHDRRYWSLIWETRPSVTPNFRATAFTRWPEAR